MDLREEQEAAFVADGGVVALLIENTFQGVEDSRAPAAAIGEGFCADEHDHEFLEVDVGVGVGAAVEDVHHGGWEQARVDAAEIAVEGELEGIGGGAGACHGDGEDGVGAEFGFIFAAVDGDHGGVDEALVAGVHAGEFWAKDGLYVFDCLKNSFAEVVVLVSIAELDGFVLAGGGSAGNGGASSGSAVEEDIGFDGGVAAGVEDFACVDRDDLGHVAPVFLWCGMLGDDAMVQAFV